MTDLIGSVLDRRYRVTGLLGKGGMGNVYEAVHLALEQRVAVKVLLPRYADEERFRARFLQEARAASKIRHRNVVEIKDFGETPDGLVFFVMEYLEGHDLGHELRERGPLPWARTREILIQAASALHAAHVKRIIHRDIKPGNCFLLSDESAVDVVKLLDFGIAKVSGHSYVEARSQGLTGTGEVFGTAKYMSPEQARGEPLDARSDIYSLGIMAYEMLVGHVPFRGATPFKIIERHVSERPKPLRDHDPRIASDVEAVVLKMIAKAPHDRYASMLELEHALREITATARRTMPWTSPGGSRVLDEAKSAGADSVGAGSSAAGDDTVADAPMALAETRQQEHVLPTEEGMQGQSESGPPASEDSPLALELGASTSSGAVVSNKATLPAVEAPLAGTTSTVPDAGAPVVLKTLVATGEPMGWQAHAVDGPPASDWSSSGRRTAVADADGRMRSNAFEAVPRQPTGGRPVLVVGLLVLVGGAVLGTMTLLADRRAGVERDAVERSAADDVLDTAVSTLGGDSSDGGADTRGDAAHGPSMLVVEQAHGSTSVGGSEESGSATGGSVEVPTPPSLGGRAPAKPPEHEKAQCVEARELSATAFSRRKWEELVGLTGRRRCWPADQQGARQRMLVRALLELGRFEQCVDAGRGAKDPEAVKWLEICRKQVSR